LVFGRIGLQKVYTRWKGHCTYIALDGEIIKAVDEKLHHHIAINIYYPQGYIAAISIKLHKNADKFVYRYLPYIHLKIGANATAPLKILYAAVVYGVALVKVGFAIAGANRVERSVALVGRVFKKLVYAAIALRRYGGVRNAKNEYV
jgi:hypothetical protein